VFIGGGPESKRLFWLICQHGSRPRNCPGNEQEFHTVQMLQYEPSCVYFHWLILCFFSQDVEYIQLLLKEQSPNYE
jgi:hypothetical protein